MVNSKEPQNQQTKQEGASPSPPQNLIKLGNMVVDVQRHIVTIANQPIELSPTEFGILVHLAQRSPQVVSPQELVEYVHGYEADGEEARPLIRTNIYRIRQKVRAVSNEEDIIRTVRGKGYSLHVPQKDEKRIDGRYRLLQRLGEGTTSVVYKAYQESLDRSVAIKFLRYSLLDDATFRQRFQQEARHMASLQHPNILQVYDFGHEDDRYYIVMEYIEGQTLEEKLNGLEKQQQRLPPTQALQIVCQIAQALTYAHQQEMIHRDVKPGNIMLAADGRIVLMDFGLAKLVTAPHLTAEGQISGTPNYMAPEQIQGMTLDTRVDIYGLSIILYQLITGRLPFIAEHELAVLFKHLKEAPPLPSVFVSDLAPGIEFIILKALAKHPDDRYQTMAEMLTDLEAPEKVTGTIADILPSLQSHPLPPHYLPAHLTSFIPRTREVNAIQTKLLQPDLRLLTLLGIGGVGKTRLSLEVARNLLYSFPNGVFFIDLTVVHRPALLPGIIAHIINLAEEGDTPVKEQLLAHLSQQKMLLILDNFEHILDAVSLISEILTAAPHCKVLATSREPLRLYGENLFPIPPLSLPDLRQPLAYDELKEYTAVQLFTTRAQAVNPDFALTSDNIHQVAELCVRLDGLPLALELAASQARELTAAELVTHLTKRLDFLVDGPRDRSTRQQTMRGAIDWSYSLLSEDERQAFTQLGIFAGRFSPEAAAQIVGQVNLAKLAQKSLLQQESGEDGQTRFWMLQVVREYALEQLGTEQTFIELQQKYITFYLNLAQTAEPHLTGPKQSVWFKRLEEAHDNFRAILHYCLHEEMAQTAVQIGAILWRLWAVYSYLSEGGLWLDTLLTKRNTAPVDLQAKLFLGAGRIALYQQKLTKASDLFHKSLALSQDIQDQTAQAMTLNSLGEIALYQAAYDQASQLFQESLRLFHADNNQVGAGQALTNLGQLAFHQKQYKRANRLLLQSLELAEEGGTPEAIAIVLNGLGEIARIQKQYEKAAAFYKRSLEIYRQLNYNMSQAALLHNIGQVKLAQGQFQEAERLFRESLGLLKTMEEKVYVAWNLAGLGIAILNLGNPHQAVRLFAATEALFQQFGGQLDALDQTIYERSRAKSKEQLSEEEWQQAWREGKAMPVENELLDIISLIPASPLHQESLEPTGLGQIKANQGS